MANFYANAEVVAIIDVMKVLFNNDFSQQQILTLMDPQTILNSPKALGSLRMPVIIIV